MPNHTKYLSYDKYLFTYIYLYINIMEAPTKWRGRVLPVSLNKLTNEWNILLGHDRSGYWSDFSLPGKKGISAQNIAQHALYYQTNKF